TAACGCRPTYKGDNNFCEISESILPLVRGRAAAGGRGWLTTYFLCKAKLQGLEAQGPGFSREVAQESSAAPRFIGAWNPDHGFKPSPRLYTLSCGCTSPTCHAGMEPEQYA